MKMKLLTLGTALVLGAASFSATAGSNSAGFNATATVVGECAVLPTTVNLGEVGVFNTQKIRVTGNVEIECTGSVPYRLQMVNNTQAIIPLKRAGDANPSIQARVYTDSGYTKSFALNELTGTSTGGVENVPVYFEASNMFAGSQIPAVGSYSGTIPVTIYY